MTMKHDKSNSWFIHVKRTLLKYELCEIQNYIDQPIKKTVWKKTVGKAVNKYWQKEISSLVPYYRNLQHLSIYLSLLSRSISDHHLRCGGWLNLEFSKREKHSGWAIKTIYKK